MRVFGKQAWFSAGDFRVFKLMLRQHDLGVTDIALVTEGQEMGTSRNTGSDKQTYYKLSLGGVMGEHALCEAAYST